MNLFLVYEKKEFIKELEEHNVWSIGFILQIIFNAFFLTMIVLLSTYVSFKLSHYIFRPLRELNAKMREIIKEGMIRDLEDQKESSLDITSLYEVFRAHIKAKKFENNDFKDKEDALAVIDLAEACNMFIDEEPRNHKAAGICYNNIGNI
jgi:hypothetical protein